MKPVCFFAYSACSMPARSKIILPQDNRLSNHGTHRNQNTRQPAPLPCVPCIRWLKNTQQRTDPRTTEHTEHTEIRTQDRQLPFPCVPCIRWLKKPSRKDPILEPPNTPKSEHKTARLPFTCVPCIRWLKNHPEKNRSQNHGSHRTHRNQNTRQPAPLSVCSVYSVVKK